MQMNWNYIENHARFTTYQERALLRHQTKEVTFARRCQILPNKKRRPIMKKFFRKLAAFLICVIAMSTVFPSNVEAAENKGSKINGSTKKATTFIVKTGDRGYWSDYIKISFTKGTLNGKNKFTGSKTSKKSYGRYNIIITDTKTGKSACQYAINKSSVTVKLSDNRTYKIQVVPVNDLHFWDMSEYNVWCYTSWKQHATWRIAATKGIRSCSK